jgi:hypothetical protein
MNDGIDQMRKAQEDRFFKLEQEKHLMAYVVRRGSRGVACSHNFDLDFFFSFFGRVFRWHTKKAQLREAKFVPKKRTRTLLLLPTLHHKHINTSWHA